ncbi:class I SAM-dependent methyltransferase [Stratiformator vulcanicus]|uniref:class I SAM-dependent methyltransferase n=1 Tax=Stratiformator vulcanicus TaxID=2527980 RepID=UPI0011A0FFB7|nr:class I SAM-dependent methyltransferase [Stratiformator vulcanicus]
MVESLRSPRGGGFQYDRARGVLRDEGGAEIPVIGGIPRFVRSEHLESFGRQWTTYDVAHDEEDRATFQAKTGVSLDELKGLKVLDAGCGGGRYCKIAGEAGASVVGVDHTQAVDKAQILCGHLPDVSFVQGDLKRLPFEPGSFDFVFSIGVMHHDADTRKVFDAVANMVRPGGRYSAWLYRRNQWWQERINDALRARSTKMNPEQLERYCRLGATLGGIPILKQTLNKVINFSAHPDPENRLCDTFDWYAPQYQYHHTVEELCDWFGDASFENLRVLPPEKSGRFYRWAYERNLLVGSGVNVTGVRG